MQSFNYFFLYLYHKSTIDCAKEKQTNMTKKTILVIGSSNTDMTVKTHSLPRPGETVLGGVFSMGAGGKGANQAEPPGGLAEKSNSSAKSGTTYSAKTPSPLIKPKGSTPPSSYAAKSPRA